MDAKDCRCPPRPYLGGMARDSQMQIAADGRWEQEHGSHPYARSRDNLAHALQYAEGTAGSGEAVLDMVADVFGQPRPSRAPTLCGEAVREAHRRNARIAGMATDEGVPDSE